MKNIIILFALSTLFACAEKEQGDTLLMFMEKESGVEPFQTRMIVTKDFIRIDDGQVSDSFVLFDRANKIVYSTNPADKAVMAVHEKKFPQDKKLEPPFALTHSVKELSELKDSPKIGGMKAKHYQLITNDKICYDVVAVKDLLPEAVKALREFHSLMATDSAQTFNNMPADMHDACDMTLTTFAPTQYLQFGFPIQEWGKREYVRTLINYQEDYKADPKLFVLPEGYQRYTVQELREGKVTLQE
jgi:hypothetical protein